VKIIKTVGIIAEYNPFHNGHKFHIEEAKRLCDADAVVVVMSGNYIQRGDCATFDKQTRARAAILGGADLIIELPTVFAGQTAEIFARSAVYLMNALGCVDYLAFGAETNDISGISAVADFLSGENHEFDKLIRAKLKTGISYATARAAAVGELLDEKYAEILCEPNNILGVEYLKALNAINSKIVPILVQRRAVGHNDFSARGAFASASLIRKMTLAGGIKSALHLVPNECMDLYGCAQIHTLSAVETAILASLRKGEPCEIAEIADVSEGLENRIFASAKTSTTLDMLINEVKTKRYTHARLRRIMLHTYLGITAKDITSPQYLRILDFSPRGREVLNNIKKLTTLTCEKNFH